MKAKILLAVVSLLWVAPTLSNQEPPKNFFYHRPMLIKTMKDIWPEIDEPSVIPGLIEQETCISLTHRYCWSRFAKFETKRERGVGLFMATEVFGRFNVLQEMKAYDQRLKQWDIVKDWSNAEFQMIGGIHKVKRTYNTFKDFRPSIEQWAASLSAYNGGIGGVRSDQRICRNTKGCDSTKWFDHVEHTSLKKKTAINSYKVSFFEINRKYPKNVLFIRRQKYQPFIDKEFS